MLEKIIKKFPLNVMKRRDAQGRIYIRAYKNVYEKLPQGGGRSKIGQCIQMGRLQEDGSIKLGKSFLTAFPEFAGHEVYYLDNELLTRKEYECAKEVQLVCEDFKELPQPEDEHGTAMTFGPAFVLDKLARKQNLPELLEMTFGRPLGMDIYNLALYAVLENGTGQHFEKWCKNNWLPTARPLSSQRVSEVYAQITPEKINDFWANKIQHRLSGSDSDIVCCAVDSTSISTYSQTIVEAAYGHNKQNENLKQVNLVMALDAKRKDVIFTKFVDGSIPDVRSFEPFFSEMTKRKFPVDRFCLVMDRGYDSAKIIEQLLNANTRFTLGMKTYDWINKAIIEAEDTFDDPKNWSVRHGIQGISMAPIGFKYGSPTQKATLKMMGYKNLDRASREHEHLMSNLASYRDAREEGKSVDANLWRAVKPFITFAKDGDESTWSFNQKAIKDYKKVSGTFTLMTNMYDNPWDTLDCYRRRNVIEMGFDWLKNEVDARRLGVRQKSYAGLLFTRIVSQMMRLALYNAMVESDLPRQGRDGGLNTLLQDLNYLKIKYENGTWVLPQIPKRYSELLEALGIKLPA